jgi:hypothetical protein
VAEAASSARESEVESRRQDLARQVKLIHKRALRLRNRLAEMNPEDEAYAELTGGLEDLDEDLQWAQYALYQLAAYAMATVLESGEVVYRYTAADIKAWCDRAEDLGATHPQIREAHLKDLVRMRSVPNAPFRARAQAVADTDDALGRITLHTHFYLRQLEQSDGADYGSKHFVRPWRGGVNAQTRHFERMVGTQVVENGSATMSLRLFIPYETGVALMRALGMTPQEAGL